MKDKNSDRADKQGQGGLSLFELMVGLAIVALIVIGLFATFPASRLWIRQAGEKTMETVYAASVLELLRNNALLLQQQLQEADPWTAVDENYEDQVFSFNLGGQSMAADVSPGMITTITARSFNDQVYYDGISPEGINQIGNGDQAQEVFFHASLIEVNIAIAWVDGREGFLLSTIISSR